MPVVTRENERGSLMRVKDVARELDQSVSAVYRKIASGDLPAVRLGSSERSPIRISAAELHAWLDRSRPPVVGAEEEA
jgi:excisionase family DNA binding protein